MINIHVVMCLYIRFEVTLADVNLCLHMKNIFLYQVVSMSFQIHTLTTGSGVQQWGQTENHPNGRGSERPYGTPEIQVSSSRKCWYTSTLFSNLPFLSYKQKAMHVVFLECKL